MSPSPSQNPPSGALIAATSAAILTLVPVAAYQLGALDHLPDPPSDVFASDKITGSRMAHPCGIPDSLPGIASYAVTLGLAIAARSHPAFRKPLKAKLVLDGSFAAVNVVRQVVTFRKLCSWCTGTAFCTAAMLLASRSVFSTKKTAVRAVLE